MRFVNNSKFALPPFILYFCLAPLATAARQTQQSPITAPAAPFQFAFSGNVAQVPVEISDHLVLVPIRVNGARPSWFLLDTTRPTSSLDDVRAVALGLLSHGSAGSKVLSNAVLDFPSLKISIPSLALDSFGDLSSRVGRAIQGILGADVLSHLIVVISYDRQTLQFYDPKSFQYKGAGIKLKMQLLNGVPAFDVKFSVRHRGTLHGLFSIATAQAEAVQFYSSFAAAHKFSELGQKMILFSPLDSPGDFDDHLGRIDSVQFGKITLQDPFAIFPGKSEHASAQPSSSGIAGAIGGEILDRFTVVLDSPDQSVIFEPNPHFNDLFVSDMSGLVLVATPPDFRAFGVSRVIEKSPAELVGIAVGDMLEKIDGNPASDYSLGDLRALFRQDGTEHTLTVLRNGKHLQFTLKLKPLI
ncbi:MAG TPA: PDZ domain-containing protein [Candidatus Acidoferrales bacterium]|nr:PDZ domain-containing protein [Candidatus Acidoferrales bacterium]